MNKRHQKLYSSWYMIWKQKQECRRRVCLHHKNCYKTDILWNSMFYLTNSQVSDLNKNKRWVPNHLNNLLETLIKNPLIQASIRLYSIKSFSYCSADKITVSKHLKEKDLFPEWELLFQQKIQTTNLLQLYLVKNDWKQVRSFTMVK